MISEEVDYIIEKVCLFLVNFLVEEGLFRLSEQATLIGQKMQCNYELVVLVPQKNQFRF